MIPEFIVVIVYYISDCFCFQWKHIDPRMFLKTNFDQLLSALQVLQPIFSMWAIMAQPRVITSFQSSCGIGQGRLKLWTSDLRAFFLNLNPAGI